MTAIARRWLENVRGVLYTAPVCERGKYMAAQTEITIRALLAQARGGDEQALNQLFAACRNYVALLAQTQVESRLRAKVDPSDLVQITLMEAYQGFDRFRGGSETEWLAWLRGILTHNAADFVRRYLTTDKRQIGREVRLGGAKANSSAARFFDPPDSGETPSQQLIRRERELQLADAVARLEEDQRTVILLRNLQRLPFDEVAERMGRSRPAAQMLWMRAIRKLQALLAGTPVEAGKAP
ncbi:MAG TPA: sigma-70 family RNA polymerase sigma factor [Gemmataceae bacterium]|nr:sigma-70 family RNA polymerase sigma factor [Gemmataceae bacterium]